MDGNLLANAHFSLYYNPGGLWNLGRAALATGHEQSSTSPSSCPWGLTPPACLAQRASLSCHPHKTLLFRDFRRNPSIYCRWVKLFACSFLLSFYRFGFFLPASLPRNVLFIVVTKRVRTAEFGTIHCSLQGRMSGCSMGDFVGREAALSGTFEAGAEGADPMSLIFRAARR